MLFSFYVPKNVKFQYDILHVFFTCIVGRAYEYTGTCSINSDSPDFKLCYDIFHTNCASPNVKFPYTLRIFHLYSGTHIGIHWDIFN